MSSELQRVDEQVDEEVPHRTLSQDYMVRLSTDVVEEYDLTNTVIDAVVNGDDTSVAVTDAKVGSQGRFSVGAKKCDLYGLEPGEKVNVIIDRVILR